MMKFVKVGILVAAAFIMITGIIDPCYPKVHLDCDWKLQRKKDSISRKVDCGSGCKGRLTVTFSTCEKKHYQCCVDLPPPVCALKLSCTTWIFYYKDCRKCGGTTSRWTKQGPKSWFTGPFCPV